MPFDCWTSKNLKNLISVACLILFGFFFPQTICTRLTATVCPVSSHHSSLFLLVPLVTMSLLRMTREGGRLSNIGSNFLLGFSCWASNSSFDYKVRHTFGASTEKFCPQMEEDIKSEIHKLENFPLRGFPLVWELSLNKQGHFPPDITHDFDLQPANLLWKRSEEEEMWKNKGSPAQICSLTEPGRCTKLPLN